MPLEDATSIQLPCPQAHAGPVSRNEEFAVRGKPEIGDRLTVAQVRQDPDRSGPGKIPDARCAVPGCARQIRRRK